MIRINRFLAQCGVASRRGADALVAEGRVSINGQTVRELGVQVDPDRDAVCLDGNPVQPPSATIHYMLNKPAGYDVTRGDRYAERTIYELMPRDMPKSVQAVGRLDRDTTGLLLLTNDGSLAFRLTHPRYGIEKEYICLGPSAITREQEDALIAGVALEDGLARAIKVTPLTFREIESARMVGAEHPAGERGFRMVVGLGRKRIVRRMCEAVGFELVALHRSRVGPIALENLALGKWRLLTTAESEALSKAVRA